MTNFAGGGADDVFNGGAGDDRAVGGDGADQLFGNSGDDILAGETGQDRLEGGDGADQLYSGSISPPFWAAYSGGPGSPPLLDAGAEADTLFGGRGDDQLFAGYGDTVDAGTSSNFGDTLYLSLLGAPAGVNLDFRTATQVLGGGTISGIDNLGWLQGSNFDDVLRAQGLRGMGPIEGMDGADRLIAGDETGSLFGGAGNDVLDGRLSYYLDVLYGGDGDDILYDSTHTNSVQSYGGDGADTLNTRGLTYGGAGNDTIQLTGALSTTYAYGGDGDDHIEAAESAWYLAGDAGADVISGSFRGDVISSAGMAGYLQPALDLDRDHDILSGQSGSDLLSAGYGDDVDGGSDIDTLWLSLGSVTTGVALNTASMVAGQAVSLGGGVIRNIEIIGYLGGTAFSDQLSLAAQGARARVEAGAGDDVVTSATSGIDLKGGDGDDRLISGSGADSFDGGAGSDTVDYRNAASGVQVDLIQRQGSDGDSLISIENVVGSAFADSLTGNDGDNLLTGGAGDDILNGGAGTDTAVFSGARSAYSVSRQGAVTTVSGADGVDSLVGIESLRFADQTIANPASSGAPPGGVDPALQFVTGQILVYFLHSGETVGGVSALRDWSPSEKAAAMSAAGTYSAVANLSFTETTDRAAAGLVLELTDTRYDGHANFILNQTTVAAPGTAAVMQFMATSSYWTPTAPSPGGIAYQQLLREFGHALGLTDVTQSGLANLRLTVTSFNTALRPFGATEAQGYAATPMSLDITPLQQHYGPANTNAGDTVYDLAATTNRFVTIWDSGGTDTLTTSGAQPATLDLHAAPAVIAGDAYPTLSTPFNYYLGGYYIAPGTVIENATGGGGGDLIIGNDTANTLRGNAGTDTIVGRGGDDVIYGGADNDIIQGDDGNDVIRGDAGDDRIDGLAGVDTAAYSGARSAYTITSNGGTIFVTGPEGADTLTNVEFLQFSDQTFHYRPGTTATIDFAAPPSTFAAALRDFDGNDLGASNAWVLAGHVDIQGDGDQEYILFNQQLGRWATIGPATDGKVYFDDHSWAGDTRVVGIYIDPEVQLGHAVLGGPNDSQRRFQNDLNIGNIKGILGGGDYNHDGLQEVYFSLTDGSAYLHAYMHADGNIQYANYQSQQQVIDYLAANGYTHTTWDGWF